MSLSLISSAIAVSIFMLLLHQPLPYILFGVAAGLYVILLERIIAGTEPKLG